MDDLISRQAVLDRIENALAEECRGWMIKELKTLRMSVTAIPSAQPQLKKGHWITYHYLSENWSECECDQCHKYVKVAYDYCPFCGADMRGENDD